MVVFGTRPEAIMYSIVRELKTHPQFSTIVYVTGQHKEMLKQVLDIFEVVPDYNLAIMKKGQKLFDITMGILERMKQVR